MSTKTIGIKRYRKSFWRVPGWFPLLDFELFTELNDLQTNLGCKGDILEIGTYKGKSGILLTLFAQKDEKVRLLDLYSKIEFQKEIDSAHYRDLTAEKTLKFLKKYGNEHELVEGNSVDIPKLIPSTKNRIIHIDGSHQYSTVQEDLKNSLESLSSLGVIVLDDYANFNYPGVARAFWDFYGSGEVEIIWATQTRVYFTRKSDVVSYQKKLTRKGFTVSVVTLEADRKNFDLVTLQGKMRLFQKIQSLLSLAVLGLFSIL